MMMPNQLVELVKEKIATLIITELKDPGKKICEHELKKVDEAIKNLEKGLQLGKNSHAFLGQDNVDVLYWEQFVKCLNQVNKKIQQSKITLEHEMRSQKDFYFPAMKIQKTSYQASLQKTLIDMLDVIYQQYPRLKVTERSSISAKP